MLRNGNMNTLFLREMFSQKNIHPPLQKLIMFDKMYDSYDQVLMIDSDMFFTQRGMEHNLFEVSEIGLHDHITDKIFSKLKRKQSMYAHDGYPYWGGAIWNWNQSPVRKTFANELFKSFHLLDLFNETFHDEGVIHNLAYRTGYENQSYLPSEYCHGSYFENVTDGYLIHIRAKREYDGQRVPKIEILHELKQKYPGLIP